MVMRSAQEYALQYLDTPALKKFNDVKLIEIISKAQVEAFLAGREDGMKTFFDIATKSHATATEPDLFGDPCDNMTMNLEAQRAP
jgi:hypothetical protein